MKSFVVTFRANKKLYEQLKRVSIRSHKTKSAVCKSLLSNQKLKLHRIKSRSVPNTKAYNKMTLRLNKVFNVLNKDELDIKETANNVNQLAHRGNLNNSVTDPTKMSNALTVELQNIHIEENKLHNDLKKYL